ncbi:hypothetical protein [Chelatococcus reniformis]|uniref:hypothetical protein n=1 Tax=Chelatococcus reniformis TaxID=1494448 RepID=UPI0016668989|nr:hypothetical protein [Chelatococcus reniformis]
MKSVPIVEWTYSMRALIIAIVLIALPPPGGIARALDASPANPAFTLYRKGTVNSGERVRWATFNAGQPGNDNLANCELAARLLNINLAQAQGAEQVSFSVFWCERGDDRP